MIKHMKNITLQDEMEGVMTQLYNKYEAERAEKYKEYYMDLTNIPVPTRKF